MSPPDVLAWLTGAGPYAVTVIVLVWLKLEREERQAAQKDARELRATIMEDRREQAEALAALGEATRNKVRELEERVTAALEHLRAGGRK